MTTPAAPAGPADPTERLARVGDLEVAWDPRILEPRPWTAEQSSWAGALLADAPPGPVLELFAGAGHIGQLAVLGTERRLVCVDLDEVACSYAARNAERNGLGGQVDVRCRSVESAADAGERFVLVVADPPWVTSDEVGRFPEDPLLAIDGGADGLGPARLALATAGACLLPGASLLLQLGSPEQAEALRTDAAERHLEVVEVRTFPRGTLVRLDRR